MAVSLESTNLVRFLRFFHDRLAQTLAAGQDHFVTAWAVEELATGVKPPIELPIPLLPPPLATPPPPGRAPSSRLTHPQTGHLPAPTSWSDTHSQLASQVGGSVFFVWSIGQKQSGNSPEAIAPSEQGKFASQLGGFEQTQSGMTPNIFPPSQENQLEHASPGSCPRQVPTRRS